MADSHLMAEMKLHAFLSNSRTAKVLATARLSGLQVQLHQPDAAFLKSKAFTEASPLQKLPLLETPTGALWESNAIIRYLARLSQSTLYTGSPEELAEIDTWLDVCQWDLEVALSAWLSPVFGHTDFSEDVQSASEAEVRKVLFALEAKLKGRRFLVGDRLTLADVAFCTALAPAYRLVLDGKFRKPFVNANKWFGLVAGELVQELGRFALCVQEVKAESTKAGKKDKKDKKKKEKDGEEKPKKDKKAKKDKADSGEDTKGGEDKPKKDKKKKDKEGAEEETKEGEEKPKKAKKGKKDKHAKEEAVEGEEASGKPKKSKKKDKSEETKDEPPTKPKKAETPESTTLDEDEEAAPRKKNPLDFLPPTSFLLDDWKRLYANTKQKQEVMSQFWTSYENEGWSLWLLQYQKAEGEGEEVYKTNNLLEGFLSRMDHFRRYCFGAMGVYGDEPSLEIKGALLWRGQEVPQELQEHPSFEYYTRVRVDPGSAELRGKVEEYWCCNVLDSDKAEGMTVRNWRSFL